jgi:hypothetical protein
LIEGIPVLIESTGRARTRSTTTAKPPNTYGRRQSSSPQRAKRGERCSPLCAQGSERRSTLGPSLASTAGSSVSVAASTKRTETMMPSEVERKAGLGTSITAESETSTVNPEKRTALPAVSIVVATASTGLSFWPKWAPRNRMTMKSA